MDIIPLYNKLVLVEIQEIIGNKVESYRTRILADEEILEFSKKSIRLDWLYFSI